MCGIAGVFTPLPASPRDVDASAMLSVLSHRGPDGSAEWQSPDRRYLALFRRLAIIDLATGDQPLHDAAGELVLIGNGEIYNYKELRAENAAYPYRTQGDMESIFPLARQRGDDFVHALNGMFALAIYDRMQHRLTLVRDRLGIKPLYWARAANGAIVFASEIKPILVSGLISPEIDESAVSAYLAHGYVPAPATLFRGIRKLPPAHRLIVGPDGRETLERYWFPRRDLALPKDPRGVERHLVKLLRDSVRLQLRSDVPVGALLSGGIDSGLMVALAAPESTTPINTFTVRFEGGAVDETPLARKVAERYATCHREIDVASGEIVEHLSELVWRMEEPLADASVLPNFLIEQALSREVKVALNGTGGDELFAGYPRYFQMPVERRYLSLPAVLRRRLIEPLLGRFDPHLAWKLARAEKFGSDRGAYLHEQSAYFPVPVRELIGNRMLAGRSAQETAFDAASDGEFKDADTAALYADIATYLPEDLLLLLDRTSMAVSVEGRVPYLDHRLVEAALSVPADMRTPGGQQKALQRAIARDYLPGEVIAAPKQGFASPLPAWMKGVFGGLCEQLLTSPAALARGWWTAEGVRRLRADPRRHGHRVYALVVLELAVRHFVGNSRLTTAPRPVLADLVAA